MAVHRLSKYSENRDLTVEKGPMVWQNYSNLNKLQDKFVTQWINVFFAAINELKPPYQPNYNGTVRGPRDSESVWRTA